MRAGDLWSTGGYSRPYAWRPERGSTEHLHYGNSLTFVPKNEVMEYIGVSFEDTLQMGCTRGKLEPQGELEEGHLHSNHDELSRR